MRQSLRLVDNCVKIWSLEVLSETDGPECELLATLTWHEKAVNCVRWSHNGRYLASGSDDHQVLLYELQDGPPAPIPFGSNQVPNKETWVRCSMLKSHTMGMYVCHHHKVISTARSSCVADVQDLAWSPDDRMLATCSIDNSILIWSMDHLSSVMTHPIQHLSGHQGWVKGVAWDPVGKEFACCALGGDDCTVSVWLADVSRPVAVIKECFDASVTDLSWSFDGFTLLSASLDGTICVFQVRTILSI
ncbi:hypothetical protein B5M09_010178 [Aphanomyces astaci]|uniref:CAF1B/HIR1 beta-propeller domain-containing protein n=1 Tax=Aphanomyces astaci TaxID=112090 RepID=A0A425CQM6_APHAT|nr:hypothetical protein B5M09_010178 [Aphanomyces astaci]